jgi:hypothetical protein
MAKVKNKPTQEQIAYFFNQVSIYQVRLNLQDWRIENTGKFASKGTLAEVDISLEDKLAAISIGGDWGSMPINEKTLRETALHELLHVFLKTLIETSATGKPEAVEAAEHSIVVVLEKLLSCLNINT